MAQLTQEELQSLQTLRQEYDTLIYQMGLMYVEQLNLDTQKQVFIDSLKELDSKQGTLLQTLEDKYGKGQIDLNTGEINQQ